MPWSPEEYASALRFAAEQHAGQLVPGSDLPYLVHVVQVAAEVQRALRAEAVDDPDLAVVCALLHDTVEDTACTVADVAAAFGDAVAAGVLALTKDERLPKDERMPDSLRRIKQQPREISMVKLADRITNLGPPPARWTTDKRRAYLAEGEVIATALAGASPWLDARIRARTLAYRAWLDGSAPEQAPGGRR
jgi:(p)ppGpp synthase/HD superfamily hydrolase